MGDGPGEVRASSGRPQWTRGLAARRAARSGGKYQRRRSQISPITVWTVALHVLLIFGLLSVLASARTVLSWILVALFLALSLDPAVRVLQKRGVPRTFAVLGVVLSLVGLFAVMLATLVPMVIEQGRSLIAAAPDLLAGLRGSRTVAALDARLGLIARAQRELAGVTSGSAVFHLVGGALRTGAAIVTTTVLTTFMLLFGGSLFRSLMTWVPAKDQGRTRELVARMHGAVGGYVSGTLLIAMIGGVVTTLVLLVLGVPYFLPLGLAMMLLGVVPFVGAALGAVLVVVTTFLSTGLRGGVMALAAFLLYQQVENHLLQPLVQRRTIRMNPLAIALVMLVGTAAAGILGALLSLPLVAAAQIMIEDLRERRQAGRSASH